MKILVRATNWVGDAVLSLPALEAVRARWPGAEIVTLARGVVADLYRGQPAAGRVLLFEHTGRHRGVLGLERLARELRRERFDVALLLPNSFQAAWIVWRAGIPERIGYARDGRSPLLTQAVPLPAPGEAPRHEVYDYLELLRRIGWLDALPAQPQIRLHVDAAAGRRAEEALLGAGVQANPALRVALAPGAAFGAAKCWPPERFAALADRLIAELGADVILFGAPSEQGIAARIAAAMRRRPAMLVGRPAGELPAQLAACQVLVGNDSGAAHVAAAVGLPVVALFGPTDPEATAPVTPRSIVVRRPVSCSPCYLRQCPVDHRCMERITVDEVFTAVQQLVQRSA